MVDLAEVGKICSFGLGAFFVWNGARFRRMLRLKVSRIAGSSIASKEFGPLGGLYSRARHNDL